MPVLVSLVLWSPCLTAMVWKHNIPFDLSNKILQWEAVTCLGSLLLEILMPFYSLEEKCEVLIFWLVQHYLTVTRKFWNSTASWYNLQIRQARLEKSQLWGISYSKASGHVPSFKRFFLKGFPLRVIYREYNRLEVFASLFVCLSLSL